MPSADPLPDADAPAAPAAATDPVAEARAFMAKDAFVKLLGVTLDELSPERCVCQMPLRDEFRNAAGVAHGGAIFSLADYAGACLANAQGGKTLGINGYIVYVAAAATGPLTAVAERVRAGKTLNHSQVSVTDAAGRLVATLTTTGFRLAEQPSGS